MPLTPAGVSSVWRRWFRSRTLHEMRWRILPLFWLKPCITSHLLRPWLSLIPCGLCQQPLHRHMRLPRGLVRLRKLQDWVPKMHFGGLYVRFVDELAGYSLREGFRYKVTTFADQISKFFESSDGYNICSKCSDIQCNSCSLSKCDSCFPEY